MKGEQRPTWLSGRELFLNEHGILCRKWYPQGKGLTGIVVNQVAAPKQIREIILKSLHDSPIDAHLGRSKSINGFKYRFYWSGTNRTLSDDDADVTFVPEVNPVQRENEVN